MKRWLLYVVASTVVVVGCNAALRGALDDAGDAGLAWAGGIALVVQWAAFGMLLFLKGSSNGFMLAMAGGTLARLGVLGAAGVVVTVAETGVGAEALILGLAGFLFALALLEALFLRSGEPMDQPG